MSITYLADNNAWLIETTSTAYVFGVSENNSLFHYYWGSRLPHASDYPGLGPLKNQHIYDKGGIAALEYAGWGGLNFTEPALKVTFADNVRDLVLVYQDYKIVNGKDFTGLEVTVKDTYFPLQVKLSYRVFADTDIIERWATVINQGDTPVRIEQAMAGTLFLPSPGEGNYRLTHLAGRWGAEFLLNQMPITDGKKTLESRRGHTSNQATPWFALDYVQPSGSGADEDQGQVWFGALGWSGNWVISVEQTTYPVVKSVQISAGINPFDFGWHLKPLQSFKTPVLSFGYTNQGFGEVSRLLHRYQNRHILPAKFLDTPRPVLYNSWEPIRFDVREESQIKLAERAARMGVELFVVDDGWFGARDNDRAGLGDWTVSPSKLPEGLGPLINYVHSLGMQFGLWVEPEMINPDSDLYREHPDWVYHFPNRARTESRNQLVLNLSRLDVQEYLFNVLDSLLENNDIAYIKWDYNRSVSEPGWPEAAPEEQREVWVRSTLGFYTLLDRLREAHPGVSWESCSSGGGRVDLGVLRRTDQVWTSDNTDPYDRLFIQEGYTLGYTPRAMYSWVVDSPHWLGKRETSLAYRFHSSMMGGLGIGGHILNWPEEEIATAREMVGQYKQIRHLVQDGLLYRLLSPRHGSYTAVSYVREDRQEAVLFVLTLGRRLGLAVPRIRLKGLEPATLYRVGGLGTSQITLSGAALMEHGLSFEHLAYDFASTMVQIKASAMS
ncbi:MAG: alpha-galactosidase [Chloroflexi bacterium]|nr:alpha-galactosidase [Chloroflexota bacterium]